AGREAASHPSRAAHGAAHRDPVRLAQGLRRQEPSGGRHDPGAGKAAYRSMTAARAFERTFGALEQIFEFTAEQFAAQGIPPELRSTVDLVLEELFTNMVKYGRGGGSRVRIELTGIDGGVEISMLDRGAERFDVTQAPDADTGRPIEDRKPGGLGLHLV